MGMLFIFAVVLTIKIISIMVIRPAVYEEKAVVRRVLVSEEVCGCDCCQKEIPSGVVFIHGSMLHDQGEDWRDPSFCSWACVFKYFQSEPLVGFATLPYLTVENRDDFLSALKALSAPSKTNDLSM